MNQKQPPTPSFSSRLKSHFLTHQRLWSAALLVSWALANTLLLATTEIMEARRRGSDLPWWEPFSWEVTSISVILLLVWPIARLISWLQARFSLPVQLVAHLLLTLPFSIIHVGAMVVLRKLWYSLVEQSYNFGHLGYEFLYEYRKDAMTYFILVAVISCYRFIVRRLQGEASYMDESENSTKPMPDRLLIKKLGKEFLISTSEIDWIEACGNYANLHLKGNVYPMRVTMAKLEARLPKHFCRVHRSSIVNIHAIEHIEPLDSGDYRIRLHNGEEIPLSRRYREACRALLAGEA